MSVAACPVCAGVHPEPASVAPRGAQAGHERVLLSLPRIHCAACIRNAENALRRLPEVSEARVNLSLKRAIVYHDPAQPVADLVAALGRAGIEAHPLDERVLEETGDAEGRALLVRVGVAGFAMMNVMLLSVAVWSGAADATRDFFHWISAAIAIPTALFAAQPFFANAWRALRVRALNMDVPISLAILLAIGMSLFETMESGQHAYFDAALSLTFFLLAGRYLDHRMRRAARSAARELAALEAPRVTRIENGTRREVAVADVRPGDRLWFPAGSRLPVDGVLEEGESLIDSSFLTGESRTEPARPGQELAAGTVNATGPVTLRVTRAGEDTTLRRMAALVATAESARGRYTSLADRAARIYAPAVHLLALAAFAGWMFATGDARLSLNVAVAVLIITCPCALGLAVPAVATTATARLFRNGLLVKNETALERLAEVTRVALDKTGTLTRPAVDVSSLPATALPVLKALAAASSHPVAREIDKALEDVAPAALTRIEDKAGEGVRALCQGREVRLGSAAFTGAPVGPALRIGEAAWPLSMGETVIEGARAAVEELRRMGLGIEILTGDAPERAERIARALGIERVRAGLSPEEKLAALDEAGAAGEKVLMVGDGLNDTAALAAAHAAAAPARALDASRSAADIVMLGEGIGGLPLAVATARKARRLIKQNFALAAGYNLVAIPLALAGLATPLLAALAMSASSITVLLNALRAR